MGQRSSGVTASGARYRAIRDKQALLYQQLPALALRSIRYVIRTVRGNIVFRLDEIEANLTRGWFDSEARGSTHPVLKAYLDTYLTTRDQGDRLPRTRHTQQLLGPTFIHLLTAEIPSSNRELWERNLKYHVLAEIYKEEAARDSSSIPMLDPARERDMQQRFLQRLRFPRMEDRKAEIRDAYGSSFKWILESGADTRSAGAGFRDWLSNPQGLFWISGKPGAGKSTLVKYILDSLDHVGLANEWDSATPYHPTASSSRQPDLGWKRGMRTTTASFFFTGAGTPMQRNSAGFLRSVLFQILSQDPGSIPSAASSRWEALSLFDEDPKPLDEAELQRILVSTLRQRHAKFKTILFVDALDECDLNSGHLNFLDVLRQILACPGIKVCVSSRPLTQSCDVIDSAPSLVIENCTRGDMEEFITSKIQAQLSMTPEADIGLDVRVKLAEELTTKASGCFLWAALVLQLLRGNLAEKRGSQDLLRLIAQIPPDLNGLFRSLLDELDASQPFVALVLRFVSLSQEPLSLIRLSFMEKHFPEFVLKQEIESLSPKSLELRAKECVETTVSRSKGLLETISPESEHLLEGVGAGRCATRVILTHRSVREFLLGEDAPGASFLRLWGTQDLAARYCAASVSMLKIASIADLSLSTISIEATRCAHTALFTRTENEQDVMRILDELEYTCHSLLECLVRLPPWSPHGRQPIHHVPMEERILWYPSNLSAARGSKVSTKLQERSSPYARSIPLLD